MSHLEGMAQDVKIQVDVLLEELKKLEEEEQKLLEELAKLKPLKGYLEFKWVRNKIGRKYWYWYLRWREGGKLKSMYIRIDVVPELMEREKDKAKAKQIIKKLKLIRREKMRIYRKLSKAHASLMGV